VNAADGRELWKRRTGGPVPSTPAVAGDIVYVGSYDGKFYALDAKTGETRWKFSTGGERRFEAKGLHGQQPKNQTIADAFDVFLSSPVVGGGSVYFGSGDGHVYSLDAASGALNWKFRTGDVVHASPAYADGVVYFGSWDSYFYAVDARTGAEKWRFHGGEDPFIHNQVGFQSSPAVVTGSSIRVAEIEAVHRRAAPTAKGISTLATGCEPPRGARRFRHVGFKLLCRAGPETLELVRAEQGLLFHRFGGGQHSTSGVNGALSRAI
jgi:outer membrane protein assembly factor BamB